MASPAVEDQRRKEDLEILALFDSDSTQNLIAYANTSGLSSPNSSIDFEFPTLTDNENEDDWILDINFDADTLAFLDEIIAADEASRANSAAAAAPSVTTTPTAVPTAEPVPVPTPIPTVNNAANNTPSNAASNAANTSATPSTKPADDEADSVFSVPRKLKCPMCPKEFYCNAALRRHGCRHILKLISCPCGFKGRSLVQAQKHYGYHHSGVLQYKFLASF